MKIVYIVCSVFGLSKCFSLTYFSSSVLKRKFLARPHSLQSREENKDQELIM